jgi:hypothetical protein
MNKLKLQLLEMESYIDSCSKLRPTVSSVPISWQLHHSLFVIIGISKVLLKSDPKEYKKDFNIRRNLILTINKIPRGKGKSPDIANKVEVIEKEEIQDLLIKANEIILKHDSLADKSFYKHHYFGVMNKYQSLKFLTIHTEHHLKIIRDILK